MHKLNERQKLIKKGMKIDGKAIVEQIVPALKSYFSEAKKDKAVIGVSGGIDSAVTAYLLAQAIGPKNIIPVYLPSGDADAANNLADFTAVCDSLRIPFANRRQIDIADMVAIFVKEDPEMSPLRLGNLKARIRMIELYDLAFKYDGLVVGTSNRSELRIGYFTKFGDGGVDIEPIEDLYKTQIFQLARYLKVSKNIRKKKPSANLWPGQTDEKEIGYSYEFLDVLLFLMESGRANRKKLVKYYGYSPEDIDAVWRKIYTTEHKRKMPPVFKINYFKNQ